MQVGSQAADSSVPIVSQPWRNDTIEGRLDRKMLRSGVFPTLDETELKQQGRISFVDYIGHRN